jgi:hypothetical protein
VSLSFLFYFCDAQSCPSPSSLIGWYHADNNYLDSSDYKQHLGAPTPAFASGIIGSSFKLDLVTNTPRGTFSVPANASAMTICMFARNAQSVDISDTFFTYYENNGQLFWTVFDPFSPKSNWSGGYVNHAALPNLYPGWTQTCFLYDRINRWAAFTYNGTVFNSTFASSNPVRGNGTLILGCDNPCTYALDLDMDEVMIFTRILTANEMSIIRSLRISCCGISSANPAVCNSRGTCNYPEYVIVYLFTFS